MARKKKSDRELTFAEEMALIVAAGISQNGAPNRTMPPNGDDGMLPLDVRIANILGIADNGNRKSTDMLFFVMYDITSNKVRSLVVKYLERNGCQRIQKSIFVGDRPVEVFNKIKDDLAEVQAAYDNNDSILIVPISTDYLRAMRVIGQNIDLDVVMHSRNTLFF